MYGYNSAGQVIDAEAVIVREILERTAAGESMRRIANDLNARGVPSPGARWNRSERRNDGRWLVSALNAMLQNERYIGRLVWNKTQWVKDPDSGKRIRRDRPETEWAVTECPALVEQGTWGKVQVRMKERATGGRRGHGLRRYLLSGLLVCEHCGARLIVTGSGASHYGCSSYLQGGNAACRMDRHLSRKVAESVVLEPIQRDLLTREAIERACELIRGWVRAERTEVQKASPEADAVAVEIADLEGLIEAPPARASTLRPLVEELRTKQANLQRANLRKSQSLKGAKIPAEESYKSAVAELAATLEGSNLEAARAALRSLVGSIPVFQQEGKLYGRIGLNAATLVRASNPNFIECHGSGGVL